MTPEAHLATVRALVASLFPALAEAMLAGAMPRTAIAKAAAVAGPTWRRIYGVAVADAALVMLLQISPAVILCPDVQDAWLASAPVEAIAPRTPVEAIAPAPPARGIRGWLQAVADFWRWRGD